PEALRGKRDLEMRTTVFDIRLFHDRKASFRAWSERVRATLEHYSRGIGFGPRGNDIRRVHRVGSLAEKVIGVLQAHEALGMLRSREDAGRVRDIDRRIA